MYNNVEVNNLAKSKNTKKITSSSNRGRNTKSAERNASSKNSKKYSKKKKSFGESRKNEFLGLVFIALAIFLAVAFFTEATGSIGAFFSSTLLGLLGVLAFTLPMIFLILGIVMIAKPQFFSAGRIALMAVAAVVICSFVHLFWINDVSLEIGFFEFIKASFEFGNTSIAGGGALGAILVFPLMKLIGIVGSYIFFIAAIIALIMIVTKLSLKQVGDDIVDISVNTVNKIKTTIEEKRIERAERKELYIDDIDAEEPKRIRKQKKNAAKTDSKEFFFDIQNADGGSLKDDGLIGADRLFMKPYREKTYDMSDIYEEEYDIASSPIKTSQIDDMEDVEDRGIVKTRVKKETANIDLAEETASAEMPAANVSSGEIKKKPYVKPPLSLLEATSGRKGTRNGEEFKKNSLILEETLKSFGISAKVVNISRGPVITRYELQPAPGVKVSRIVNLSDDIALNLAASHVRIEAPIPGKSAVGIEVPNANVDTVFVRELLAASEFKDAKSPLFAALGRDLAGKGIYTDIAKAPHLLIAGATGSGKSVCVNTLITSLLYKATPEEVKFIMIDPKMVELSAYNGIPHLYIPVVTDAKKAASALNWAVQEMVDRYKMFAEKGAKDIIRYNSLMKETGGQTVPYAVVIVDELADLMSVSKHEVEDAICRIAQLGRASGIHLVIATQRPSVDVITGVIKANVPSRIAFSVSSQVDSRTILDMAGAEKLIGKGDMLFHPIGAPKPMRLQGAFIQDAEVERVIDFLKNQGNAEYDADMLEEISQGGAQTNRGGDDEAVDELFRQAVEVGLECGQVSVSMLQRRLRVGYARAGRLLDEMEARSLVSPFEGAKPRQMLITREEFEQLFND